MFAVDLELLWLFGFDSIIIFYFIFQMTAGITKLFDKIRADFAGGDGMKWLNISHDCWSTTIMDGAIGSSARVVTSDMKCISIATCLLKNNDSHGAKVVAGVLSDVYKSCYNVDVLKDVKSAGSDTASAARGVSAQLGVDQEDCEMHVVNLCVQYGLGVKENYETIRFKQVDGTVNTHREIRTPGGSFPGGMATIKTIKEIANYFDASGKRKKDLQETKEGYGCPELGISNPGTTRVSSTVTMFQSAMANFFALSKHFMSTSDADFKKKWKDCWSSEHLWKVCILTMLTCLLLSYV